MPTKSVASTMARRLEKLYQRLESAKLRPYFIVTVVLSLASIVPLFMASLGWMLWPFVLPAIAVACLAAWADYKQYRSPLHPALLLSPLIIPGIIVLLALLFPAPHSHEGTDPHAAYRDAINIAFYTLFCLEIPLVIACSILYPQRKWIPIINSLFALTAHCLVSFLAGMALSGNWL